MHPMITNLSAKTTYYYATHLRHFPRSTVVLPPASLISNTTSDKLFFSTTDSSSSNTIHHNNAHALPTTKPRDTTTTSPPPHLPLPHRFLRQMCHQNFDLMTHQRKDISFHPETGKPLSNATTEVNCDYDEYWIESPSSDGGDWKNDEQSILYVKWMDGSTSRYPIPWIKRMVQLWKHDDDNWANWTLNPKLQLHTNVKTDILTDMSLYPHGDTKRILWNNLSEDRLRTPGLLSLPFSTIVNDSSESSGQNEALRILYQYGILLVTDTPFDDGMGIAAFASAVSGGSMKHSSSTCLVSHYLSSDEKNKVTILPDGTDGPMRTLYGNVWSTHSSGMADGASVADSAYGQGALPLHTDLTYYRDPPGLQIFNMIQPAQHGGESTFADGFYCAHLLRELHPDAFHTLSNTIRKYRCIDTETGWHLEASGPVIQLNPNNDDDVVMIRHNDLDRMPDLPPSGRRDEHEFYEELRYAHEKWDEILGRDDVRLVVNLQGGDMVVVANQRCFHARHSFSTPHDAPRAVRGCYVSQDDLNSRFRQEGFVVD